MFPQAQNNEEMSADDSPGGSRRQSAVQSVDIDEIAWETEIQ
jgi:hypothetical protein